MGRSTEELLSDFRQRYDDAERSALVGSLLSAALWEAPCPECGRVAFAVEPGDAWSRFECPECRAVAWVGRRQGAMTVLSARRRLAMLRAACRRRWYCPEHDGVRARLVGLDADPLNPAVATVRYLCRRSRGLLRSPRVHTGTFHVNLLALEA